MKTLVTLSSVFILFIIFLSCKKENVGGTQTITLHDTIRIHDTVVLALPTRKQILVSKEWEVDNLLRNQAGSNSEYLKGGINTTGVNYQNLKVRFNADNTGTYIDETGGSHTLNWSFTTADERTLSLVVGPPFANTFPWRLVELKDNYLHCTTPFTGGLLSVRFKQIP